MLTFSMNPLPPFRLDLTVWVLRRLPVNAIDRWDGRTYSRTIVIDGCPAEVSAIQTGPSNRPELSVTVDGIKASARNMTVSESVLKRALGLDIDLSEFYAMASADRKLDALVGRFMGVKPPRFPSVYESLINGISCQQLSLAVGIHLLNRISSAYGHAFKEGHAFPQPEELARSRLQVLRKLGYSVRKAQNIVELSRDVISGSLDLEGISNLDNDTALERLIELPGVGRWTAQYVMLRGMGRLDVFPADDVGSQNKLMRWLNLKKRPDYEGMHRILDKWSPYRGIIYFYLLLDNQASKGFFDLTRPAI
jgi:DNA-3-methyladenine glycosylase II